MELSIIALLLAANLIVAVATFVQFTTGIGYAMIAMPMLALLDLSFVPGPALCTMLVLAIFMTATGRNHIYKPQLPWLVAGLLIGTIAGTFALAILNPVYFGLVFGALVLAALLMTQLGINTPHTPAAFCTGGFCSGFMGTISGIHGPVLAVVYHTLQGPVIRATIAMVFIVATLLSLIFLASQNLFDMEGVKKSAFLLPGLTIGLIIAVTSNAKINPDHAKRAMTVIATVSALLLICNSLLELV